MFGLLKKMFQPDGTLPPVPKATAQVMRSGAEFQPVQVILEPHGTCTISYHARMPDGTVLTFPEGERALVNGDTLILSGFWMRSTT